MSLECESLRGFLLWEVICALMYPLPTAQSSSLLMSKATTLDWIQLRCAMLSVLQMLFVRCCEHFVLQMLVSLITARPQLSYPASRIQR